MRHERVLGGLTRLWELSSTTDDDFNKGWYFIVNGRCLLRSEHRPPTENFVTVFNHECSNAIQVC